MTDIKLPGLNCGICGYRSCDEFRDLALESDPDLIVRCIHLSRKVAKQEASCGGCSGCGPFVPLDEVQSAVADEPTFVDSLGRKIDFYLEHFPEDPGPREIIIPHNPMITRELEIKVGDVLIGRPLGMSCGCPITHCGVVREVDPRTGVMTWCVTGPLQPRQSGYKDLGYYIAEGYEGLVMKTSAELKIGMRYWFQPRMCMLQWRHSGLLNYLNKSPDYYQVRLEGLWIG